jgi:hypothetical protein
MEKTMKTLAIVLVVLCAATAFGTPIPMLGGDYPFPDTILAPTPNPGLLDAWPDWLTAGVLMVLIAVERLIRRPAVK